MTPKQKAEVVRLIKTHLNKITLAIGDGSNDVNMIQEAHIGIGIYGKEGMRAVQASDFAIGEFQCLWRLLLIHGRWCYVRISQMIIYFFYKNMIFTIPHFFFSFACASSAQTIFDDWYISFYNLFFTALPLIMRAVFEQDIDYKIRSAENEDHKNKESIKKFKHFLVIQDAFLKSEIPKLYAVGQNKTIFTTSRFVAWVLWAIFQSLVLFGLNYLVFEYIIFNNEGLNGDLWSFSITYFTTIILLVDFKLAINTTYWICLHWIALFPLSILLYFAYFFVSNYLATNWSYLTPMLLIRMVQFYAAFLLGLLAFALIDYLIFCLPDFVFVNKLHTLVKYAVNKRNNCSKCDEIYENIDVNRNSEINNFVVNDDVDEKVPGDLELTLQNHHSIERTTTINKLNIIKF